MRPLYAVLRACATLFGVWVAGWLLVAVTDDLWMSLMYCEPVERLLGRWF